MQPPSQGFSLEGGRGGKSPGNEVATNGRLSGIAKEAIAEMFDCSNNVSSQTGVLLAPRLSPREVNVSLSFIS